MEAADLLGATLGKTDPEAWRHLLVYCPDWLIFERAKRITAKAQQQVILQLD